MQIFSHINDAPQSAWHAVPDLCLISPRVVLWSPSASLMDDLGSNDPLVPSPDDMLWLVNKGFVQVIAREWWLKNDNRRKNHPWRHAKWIQGYDDKLLRWYEEDQDAGRTGIAGRVLLAPEETGDTWAQELVDSKKVDSADVVRRVMEHPSPLLDPYRVRVSEYRTDEEKAIRLLRDSKNHGEAFAATMTDRLFMAPEEETLLKIVGEFSSFPGPKLENIWRTPTPDVGMLVETIREIMERLRRGQRRSSALESGSSLNKPLLGDEAELTNFRKWVHTCDAFAATMDPAFVTDILAERLADNLELGTARKTFIDYFAGQTLLERAMFSLQAVLAGIAVYTGAVTAPISVSALVGLRALGLAEWLGWKSERFNGERWLFLVAYESRDVYRKNRRRMIESVLSRGTIHP